MADDNTLIWMVPVTPEVAALSAREAKALVLGSSFARRIRSEDPEHGARMCDHGRLLFKDCGFCAAGVPAFPDPTFDEMAANAAAWLSLSEAEK